MAALASDRLMISRAEPRSKSSAAKLLRMRGEGDRIDCAAARPLPFTWRGAALIGRKCLRLDQRVQTTMRAGSPTSHLRTADLSLWPAIAGK